MKTLNWCKIPAGRVLAGGSGGDNLWARVAASHNGTNESLLDFEGMEELFCQQQSQPSTPQMQRRQRTSQRKAQEVSQRRQSVRLINNGAIVLLEYVQ